MTRATPARQRAGRSAGREASGESEAPESQAVARRAAQPGGRRGWSGAEAATDLVADADDEPPVLVELPGDGHASRRPRSSRGSGASGGYGGYGGSGGSGAAGGSRGSRWTRGDRSPATGTVEDTTDPESRARELCLAWLSVRPHTRAELARKLRTRGVPEDAAAAVLDRYDEVGLVDDAAFSRAWVESRRNGRGLARRALAQELRTRGVDGDTIADAVAVVSTEDEAETARALVDRKLRSMDRLDPTAKARRLIGMLARKGYGGALAARVVREALDGSGVDIPDPDHDHR